MAWAVQGKAAAYAGKAARRGRPLPSFSAAYSHRPEACGGFAGILQALHRTAMTSIDPHQRLAAALQKAGGLQERRRPSASPPGSSTQAAAQTATQVLAQRLRSIEPADPQRRQKAMRLYLESALAREFGQELLNDPAFAQMVEAVQSQMQEDPDMAAAVQAAADLLLAGELPA